jgi:hypothetical protein
MKMMLIALAVAVGAGGCAKTRKTNQVVAQSSGGGNKGGPPATLGPAGTAEIPPSPRTRPQTGHGTGGSGPSGAGGERKAPEPVGTGGSSGTQKKKK